MHWYLIVIIYYTNLFETGKFLYEIETKLCWVEVGRHWSTITVLLNCTNPHVIYVFEHWGSAVPEVSAKIRLRLRWHAATIALLSSITSLQVISDVDNFLLRGANSLSKWGRKRKLESRGRTDIIILPKKQVCQSNESIILTHFGVHVVC